MEKVFEIVYNPINGEIDYKNEDDMTYSEVLGAIEYTKMLITKRWMDELEDEK